MLHMIHRLCNWKDLPCTWFTEKLLPGAMWKLPPTCKYKYLLLHYYAIYFHEAMICQNVHTRNFSRAWNFLNKQNLYTLQKKFHFAHTHPHKIMSTHSFTLWLQEPLYSRKSVSIRIGIHNGRHEMCIWRIHGCKYSYTKMLCYITYI
jgi:hypothetical protein